MKFEFRFVRSYTTTTRTPLSACRDDGAQRSLPQSALRPEGRDQQGQQGGEQRDHPAPTLGDSVT